MTREVAASVPLVRALLRHLSEGNGVPRAPEWHDLIRRAYRSPDVRGGMKGWSRRANWKQIDLLMAKYDLDNELEDVRVVGPRVLRTNPTGVMLFGGEGLPIDHRFNRVTAVALNDTTMVGYSADYRRIVVYHLADGQKV
jgi:hypothetical protein